MLDISTRTPSSQARPSRKLSLWVFAALLAVGGQLQAEEIRYISDKIYVPLRSGTSTNHRIVHRGLPSGTRLVVLEEDADSGYSMVRTDRGVEGWILSHYLDREPIAAAQLERTRKELAALKERHEQLREKLGQAVQSGSAASNSVTKLQEENQLLMSELENIKRVSAGAIKLDSDYKNLTESYQVLKDQVDVLQTENARLRDNHENEAFLNGAFAVVIGVLIALVAPRLRPKKRSEWI